MWDAQQTKVVTPYIATASAARQNHRARSWCRGGVREEEEEEEEEDEEEEEEKEEEEEEEEEEACYSWGLTRLTYGTPHPLHLKSSTALYFVVIY